MPSNRAGEMGTASNLNKAERIAYIDDRLQALYPETPVPLDHTDPYTLLIAVLLSAQCTDERVNQVTPGLFAKADCPEDMVQLSVEEIRSIIRPCGLSPQKSKAIHRLSELLLEHHNGEVPADLEALEKLPASATKRPASSWRKRLDCRPFLSIRISSPGTALGSDPGAQRRRDGARFEKAFPKARWNALHLQIIYYGREYCTARGCDGRVCEICTTCYPARKHPKRCNKA